jgi:hypothetical protein
MDPPDIIGLAGLAGVPVVVVIITLPIVSYIKTRRRQRQLAITILRNAILEAHMEQEFWRGMPILHQIWVDMGPSLETENATPASIGYKEISVRYFYFISLHHPRQRLIGGILAHIFCTSRLRLL